MNPLRVEVTWNAEVAIPGREPVELEITTTANVTPGYEGKFTGPMEGSYPAEPAEVQDMEHEITGVGDDETKAIEDFLYDLIVRSMG